MNGARMPADACDAPRPGARMSRTVTDAPRLASASATAAPMMPEPMTITCTGGLGHMTDGVWRMAYGVRMAYGARCDAVASHEPYAVRPTPIYFVPRSFQFSIALNHRK